MTDKPVQIKEFNGVDYDNIYPKTTLDQVDGAKTYIDSKTLKTLYSNNMSFNNQAWEGSINIPDEIVSNMATSNFLSFELVFCRGLILRYQASNGGSIGISLENTGDIYGK